MWTLRAYRRVGKIGSLSDVLLQRLSRISILSIAMLIGTLLVGCAGSSLALMGASEDELAKSSNLQILNAVGASSFYKREFNPALRDEFLIRFPCKPNDLQLAYEGTLRVGMCDACAYVVAYSIGGTIPGINTHQSAGGLRKQYVARLTSGGRKLYIHTDGEQVLSWSY